MRTHHPAQAQNMSGIPIAMKKTHRTSAIRIATVLAVSILLGSCFEGSSYTTATQGPAVYTVGGTVQGLATGATLGLRVDGQYPVSVSTNASFTFPGTFSNGAPYAVTVDTQPSGQKCWAQGGSGTVAGANVTSVLVACTSAPSWTFVSGSTSPSPAGVNGAYPTTAGTAGTTSAPTAPGSRVSAATWKDSSGNVWMFGGSGNDSAGTQDELSDLWEYITVVDPIAGTTSATWTWMGGSNLAAAPGSYPAAVGTSLTSAAPGARDSAVTWTDSAGNLWLFGGYGYDSAGTRDDLNDVWEYTPATSTTKASWTWVAGSNVTNAAGVYPSGGVGTTSTSATPGARYGAVSWVDVSGSFWLFGGTGHDGSGATGYLNDLWKLTPGAACPAPNTDPTVICNWTWVGGSSSANASANYPTLGTSSSTADPGGRYYANAWADVNGNLWLWGGVRGAVYLSDLWLLTPGAACAAPNASQTCNWTWVSGSSATNDAGTYGTMGVGATANSPPARAYAASWADGAGSIWLFAGYNGNELNDVWEYTPNVTPTMPGTWTWVSGSSGAGPTVSSYGTPGVAGGTPSGRDSMAAWTDLYGNVWFFGGYDNAEINVLDEMWTFVPGP